MPQNEELELQYKTCYARILDSKRRFLEVRCGQQRWQGRQQDVGRPTNWSCY